MVTDPQPGFILLVEDDEDIRTSLTELLELENYSVLTAVHGEDALDKLQSPAELPRLILLDLTMPVMDGKTFLERKALDGRLRDLPVLLFSAAMRDVCTDSVKAVIRKPVDIDELLQEIRQHFSA